MDNFEKTGNGSCWEESTGVGEHQPASPGVVSEPYSNINTENCMVCGSPLEYLEQAKDMTCTYCGKIERGHVRCPSGDYVCDTCHNKGSMQAIEDIAFNTQSDNPIEISELMMSHPDLPMLGCQHAYIAAGALLAAIRNEGSRQVANEDIREVFSRLKRQAIGGYCGLTGVCGIMPALGACFSVLLGSKCGKDIEQKITMDAVTRISRAITDITGPSCCKAYVRASLLVAVDTLREKFDLCLPVVNVVMPCAYSDKHPHGCRSDRCPYFRDNREVSEVTGRKPSDPMEIYDEFFSASYQGGAIDVKTKHLIALAASLAAGCQPWTDYSIAVARQHGATEMEINEVVMVAMTVGAHKMRLMAEKGPAIPPADEVIEPGVAEEGECWTP